MLVSKYPNWVAVVTWKDGHAHFFDGAKDMFKFLHDLPKFAPGHRKEDIAAIYVTDFYNLERIDARKALFVVGSDVLGPMGHELVPLANKADAEDFLKDHKGKKILAFDRVSAEIPGAIDAGKF
jgi:nitrous oxide reductase accessory protein NosL